MTNNLYSFCILNLVLKKGVGWVYDKANKRLSTEYSQLMQDHDTIDSVRCAHISHYKTRIPSADKGDN